MGAVIVAGKPEKSLLLQRVTLPAGHKQFMPAEGRPPLRPEEIAWIKAWIQQGASPSATTLAGISIREGPHDPPLQPVGDYSALMPEIRAMQKVPGREAHTRIQQALRRLGSEHSRCCSQLRRRAARAVPEIRALYCGSRTRHARR